MAEFSKQFCDNLDMDIEPDFDCEEIFKELQSLGRPKFGVRCRHQECAGYGFVSLGINYNSERVIGFSRVIFGKEKVIWEDYNKVLQMASQYDHQGT